VAAFCTKCGAGLTPGLQFCRACGAPAGAVAGPAVVAPPPMYGQPGAPPSGGSSALKVILIVVAVVVGAGILASILATFVFWRATHAVHVNSRGDGVTLSTKDGSITTGSAANVSEADLGVPIYPGATRREGGVNIRSGSKSMVTAVFTTSDSLGKVVDFYKDKMGTSSSFAQSGDGAVLSSSDNDKQGVMVTVGKDSSNGTTTITILRTTK
jgi:hypothetical protein